MNNPDYQYQTAAQVIDQRTALGLARTPQVDLRFFRHPPPLPNLEDVRIFMRYSTIQHVCQLRLPQCTCIWEETKMYSCFLRVCQQRMD